jgi:recombination protein RecR
MAGYPKVLTELIRELSKLPGIGAKTADRLAFYLLRAEKEEACRLGDAIYKLKAEAIFCSLCRNITESNPCSLCKDPQRNPHLLLIVEQPKDLLAFEAADIYDGRYYVLMGHLAPLAGETLEPQILKSLQNRIQDGTIQEIIIATNPTVEGDGTALYILKHLEKYPIKISKIAKGISSGTTIEYANKTILSDALEGRSLLSSKASSSP